MFHSCWNFGCYPLKPRPRGHKQIGKFPLYSTSLAILSIAIALSQPKIVLSTIRIPSIGFVLPPIYWQQRNPIFRRDNTLHIIDVEIGDSIDIVCPDYTKNPDQVEYHAVYMVTKEEYDTCHITPIMNPSKTRLILNCSEPTKTQIFTISFRDFSPIPQGLEFKRGKDYYFISTSKGTLDGINNLEGGYCETHAMKVMFKVGPRRKTKIRPKQKSIPNPPSYTNQKPQTVKPQLVPYNGQNPNNKGATEKPGRALSGEVLAPDSHRVAEGEENPIYYYYNHNDRAPYGPRVQSSGGLNDGDRSGSITSEVYEERHGAINNGEQAINRASPYNPYKHSLRPIITAYGPAQHAPPIADIPSTNNIKRSEEEERVLISSQWKPAGPSLHHGGSVKAQGRGGARLASAPSAAKSSFMIAATTSQTTILWTRCAISCLAIFLFNRVR